MRGKHFELKKVFFLAGLVFLSGCYLPRSESNYRIVEPGYGPGQDTYEGRIDAVYEDIWDSIVATLEQGGVITSESLATSRVEADMGESHIVVRLEQVDRNRGQLRVQAYQRHTRYPQPVLAEEVFHAIRDVIHRNVGV